MTFDITPLARAIARLEEGLAGYHEVAPRSAAPQRGPSAYGWKRRGYLPHFDAPNTIQHITCHHPDLPYDPPE